MQFSLKQPAPQGTANSQQGVGAAYPLRKDAWPFPFTLQGREELWEAAGAVLPCAKYSSCPATEPECLQRASAAGLWRLGQGGADTFPC